MMLWMNGNLRAEEQTHISPFDRGLALGDGVFETILVRGEVIEHGTRHFERLRQSCAVLRLPYPTFDLTKAIQDVLKVNHLHDAVLRMTLTRGVGPRGLTPPENPQPTFLITAALWTPVTRVAQGVIATVTRQNEFSPLSRIKALPYLDNILALQEAKAKGADEAILLNTKGHVVSASHANLFVVKNGKLRTPALGEGALPGILRAVILDAYPVEEGQITVEELYQADEIFLTNSLGITPLASVDGNKIGQGQSVAQVMKTTYGL